MVQTHDPQLVEADQPPKQAGWRSWVVVAVVAIAGAVTFGLGVLFGAETSDDGTEAVDAPAIVEQWGEAFETEDPDGLAALYADGGSFNCRAFDFTINSEEIADVVMGDETDFTEFDPTTVLVGDEIVAVEYMVSAISP